MSAAPKVEEMLITRSLAVTTRIDRHNAIGIEMDLFTVKERAAKQGNTQSDQRERQQQDQQTR